MIFGRSRERNGLGSPAGPPLVLSRRRHDESSVVLMLWRGVVVVGVVAAAELEPGFCRYVQLPVIPAFVCWAKSKCKGAVLRTAHRSSWLEAACLPA